MSFLTGHKGPVILLVCLLLFVLQFKLDSISPRGHAAGTLYVIAVSGAALIGPYYALGLGVAGSSLILAGHFISPVMGDVPPQVIFWNRFSSMIEVWFLSLMAMLVYRIKTDQDVVLTNQNIALDAAKVGVWRWAIGTDVITWDDRMHDLYGVKRGSFGGSYDAFSNFLLPGEKERVGGLINAALEGGLDFSTDFHILRGDGKESVMHAESVLLTDSSGDPLEMIGINWDRTKPWHHEQALKSERDKFSDLVNNLNGAFWVWDNKAKGATFISRQYEKIFGRPTDPMFKDETVKDWQETVESEYKEEADTELDLQGRTEPLDYEFPIQVDGKRKWVWTRGFPVFDEVTGDPVRFVGMTEDITARKIAEEGLVRSNADLERFAFIASHDLQEPLRMVSSFLGLIEKRYSEKLDDKGREYIAFAVGGAEKMSRLINDLLKYSRAIRQDYDAETFNMSELVHEILEPFEGKARFCIGDLAEVTTGRIFVGQILQNFISNAIKYGSDRVEISLENKGFNTVVLIRDNGCGIAPEHHATIFEPFKRLEHVTPGTGVGLSICKAYAIRLGGDAWVESDLGKGSKFYFSFKNEKNTIS